MKTLLVVLATFLSLLARVQAVEPPYRIQYSDVAEDTLQQVHVIFRHGCRAPITSYPLDPNNSEDFWFGGFGHLTKEGLRQHERLGRWFRHRYGALLSEPRSYKKLFIRSADVDRTLDSAAANAAGIYEDYYQQHPEQQFRAGLAWAPTPIHTTPRHLDMLIDVDRACPKMQELYVQIQQEAHVKDYLKKLAPLMATLTERLGKNFTSLRDIGIAYDSFNLQQMYNLTLPDWVLPHLELMKRTEQFGFDLLASTPQLKMLRAGPLLKRIISDSEAKQQSPVEGANMLLYSGHDGTVAVNLQALGAYNDKKPPFASAVIYELHRMQEQHYVRIYYHNDTSMMSSLQPIILKTCNFTCDFEQFKELVSDFLPVNIRSQCGLDKNLHSYSEDELDTNSHDRRFIFDY